MLNDTEKAMQRELEARKQVWVVLTVLITHVTSLIDVVKAKVESESPRRGD